MQAHTRNGELLAKAESFEGRKVVLSDGSIVHSPPLGYTNGDDKIVPVVDVVEDQSSPGKRPERESTGWVVEKDRVYRKVTIRDETPAERASRVANRHDAEAEYFDIKPSLKALADAIFAIQTDTAPASAFASPQAFRQWLRTLMDAS